MLEDIHVKYLLAEIQFYIDTEVDTKKNVHKDKISHDKYYLYTIIHEQAMTENAFINLSTISAIPRIIKK